MRICENAAQTPGSPADVETGILRDVMADGLRRFEEALQSMADAEPSVGSDGRRLRRAGASAWRSTRRSARHA